MMASLSALGGTPGDLTYVTGTVESDCPQYTGLGENGMSFKKWMATQWMPRVWTPKMASAQRERDEKFGSMKIQALTSLQRRQVPVPAPPPAGDDGPVGPPPRPPPLVIDAVILAEMGRVADLKLPTLEDKFEMLLKYIHPSASLKESTLDEITQQNLEGQAKFDYFVERMEAATSPVVLEKARWAGIRRQGLREQPAAYATRYKRAADTCGRIKSDINAKFLATVLAPWDNDPKLMASKPFVEGVFVMEVQDDEQLHIDKMAEVVFSHETRVVQATVNQMEVDGTLAIPSDDAKGKDAAGSNQKGGSRETQAEKLGLPTKMIKGKAYHACPKCYVVRDGQIAFHSPKFCPVNKGKEAKAGDEGGRAMYGQQEFVCFNCDQPGHSYRDCPEPPRHEKLAQAKKQY